MYQLLFYPLVGRVAQGENGIFWTIIHARHNRANQPIVCTWITSTKYKDSNIRKEYCRIYIQYSWKFVNSLKVQVG